MVTMITDQINVLDTGAFSAPSDVIILNEIAALVAPVAKNTIIRTTNNGPVMENSGNDCNTYLSKFFKTQVGIGFNRYLNLFRLNKSMNDLLNSNKIILEIALDHGFSSVKSYTKIFKETYNQTPSTFRKNYLQHNLEPKKKITSTTSNAKALLQNYINTHAKDYLKDHLKQVHHIHVDLLKKPLKTITHEKIIYFDFVYDALNSNWQVTLKKIQSNIKFDYIRFNGIFNKGMLFYSKKEHAYNWFNIDNLLAFFLENNLTPFIELSYNEQEMSLKQWHHLLECFLFHCIERYGLTDVQTWKFELASEDKSYEKAISLFTRTLKKLNKNFKNLQIGILFIPHKLNTNYVAYKNSFQDRIVTVINLKLKIPNGKYEVRTKILNEENGCIFTEWLKMGSPEKLTHDDFEFLKSRENMRIRIMHVNVKDYLYLEKNMDQNEICLLEVKPL